MPLACGSPDHLLRSARDVCKDSAVLAQSDLALGATVQVIQNRRGQMVLRQGLEIFHTDDARLPGVWSSASPPSRLNAVRAVRLCMVHPQVSSASIAGRPGKSMGRRSLGSLSPATSACDYALPAGIAVPRAHGGECPWASWTSRIGWSIRGARPCCLSWVVRCGRNHAHTRQHGRHGPADAGHRAA